MATAAMFPMAVFHPEYHTSRMQCSPPQGRAEPLRGPNVACCTSTGALVQHAGYPDAWSNSSASEMTLSVVTRSTQEASLRRHFRP